MGYALGVVGMRLADFCQLSPDEFSAVCEAFAQRQDALREDSWEMMRLHASISVQPHLTKRVTPAQLLPLPWDRKQAETTPKECLSYDERLRRAEKRMRRESTYTKGTKVPTAL